ncbi:hypothetical protein [Embleya sp. NPDC005971]|uniref:hypothetical protein n=1 Tax=Embleya sp. NPDC005971 TaxID=3156724 RepID=UPI0033C68AB0
MIKLPRLLRRRHPRADDTARALLSPAYVLCSHCGAARGGDLTIEAIAWAGTHCPADADRHRLALDGNPAYTDTWLHRRGYRIDPQGAPLHLDPSRIPIRRAREPVLVARVGNTLVWDGERITVATEREAQA